MPRQVCRQDVVQFWLDPLYRIARPSAFTVHCPGHRLYQEGLGSGTLAQAIACIRRAWAKVPMHGLPSFAKLSMCTENILQSGQTVWSKNTKHTTSTTTSHGAHGEDASPIRAIHLNRLSPESRGRPDTSDTTDLQQHVAHTHTHTHQPHTAQTPHTSEGLEQ